jgi:hypothetical protein
MPEPNRIAFTYKEVVESLVRKHEIHEGIWGLYVRFGISAANIGREPTAELMPAAIIPILEIGLQKFDTENNLSVDAAAVNPARMKKNEKMPKKKHPKISGGV